MDSIVEVVKVNNFTVHCEIRNRVVGLMFRLSAQNDPDDN